MTDYGDLLSKSFRFSLHPKMWLQFFIVNMIFGSIIVYSFITNIGIILSGISEAASVAAVSSAAWFLIVFISSFIVYSFVMLWLQGSMIRQSANGKEKISSAFMFPPVRYISLLVAMLIAGFVSGIVVVVPYVGWILSIIVGLVFFFTAQGVMISKLGFAEALKNSYEMFRSRKFDVFVAWLAISIITTLVVILFALPAIVMIGSALVQSIFSGQADLSGMQFLVSLMNENMWMLFAAGTVFCIGMSIAETFTQKAITEFYMSWKNAKPAKPLKN